MTCCGACSKPLPAPRTKPRRWCSESCRVWAHRHPGQTRPAPTWRVVCAACRRRSCTCSKRTPTSDGACPICETDFPRTNSSRVYCSIACKRRAGRIAFTKAQRRRRDPTRDARRARRTERTDGARQGRRTREFREVVARDGTGCSLCPDPVDLAIAWPDPLSASLDHVIPVAAGGRHELANLRLAHLGCNIAKSDRT